MREAEPFYPVGNRCHVALPRPPGRRSLAPSDYPESDGNPMAETPIHWRATVDATDPLHEFYRERSDVYVGSDMLMYYLEGDLRRSVVPDVWVAFGVPKLPERRTWLIWREGKGPDFVLEITSRWTKREDEGRKKKLYEELGVGEYWQFDPTGDYLDPILKGRELGADGTYRNLALQERDGALCYMSLLGLELRLAGRRLYYFDPASDACLLSYTEQIGARRSADQARRTAEAARRTAEVARQSAEERYELEARRRREEMEARRAAEARVAELERRLRDE